MGLESAVLPAVIGYGIGSQIAGQRNLKSPAPTKAEPVVRPASSIEEDAEDKRRQLFEQLSRLKRQTLLFQGGAEPLLGKNTLLGVK